MSDQNNKIPQQQLPPQQKQKQQQQLPPQQFQQQQQLPPQFQQIPQQQFPSQQAYGFSQQIQSPQFNQDGFQQNYSNFSPRIKQTQLRQSIPKKVLPNEQPLPEQKKKKESKTPEKKKESIENSNISCNVEFEVSEVAYDSKKTLLGMCSIQAPKEEKEEEERPPIDLVCVIDTSGSMSGGKIELLKLALSFVSIQLGDLDRLSIVEFNSAASLVCNLTRCGPDNKNLLQETISGISAGGGTDIMSGLQMGMAILENRKYKNEISSILLLTDGQDSSSASRIESDKASFIKKFIKKTNSSIHTFGFGADHDAKVMSTIAESCGGTFTYVENNSIIGPAFATVLGGLMSVVAQKITIQLATENCTISKIRSDFTHNVSSNGKEGTITLPDLYSEERKDIIFEINLGAEKSESSSDIRIISAKIDYVKLGTNSTTSATFYGTLKRPIKESSSNKINLKLDIQKNRLLSTDVMETALKLAQSDKFKEAQQVLADAITKIKNSASGNSEESKSLIEDLENAQKNVGSSHSYKNGGYANVKSAQMQNKAQRTNYSPQKVSPSLQSNSMQMKQQSAWNSYQQQTPQLLTPQQYQQQQPPPPQPQQLQQQYQQPQPNVQFDSDGFPMN